jgi:hypothetical protein
MESTDIKRWAQGAVGGGGDVAAELGAAPEDEMGGEAGGEEETPIPLPELAENILAMKDAVLSSIADLEDKGDIEEKLKAFDEIAEELKTLAEAQDQIEEDEAAEGAEQPGGAEGGEQPGA